MRPCAILQYYRYQLNEINQFYCLYAISYSRQHHQQCNQSIKSLSSGLKQGPTSSTQHSINSPNFKHISSNFCIFSWIRKSGPTALTNITTSQSIKPFQCDLGLYSLQYHTVFRIQIRTDPHKEMSPGSRSAWTDANPDPGGKKALKKYRFIM